MTEIDPITGLPKELGAFEEISKEEQTITVSTTKKKFGKVYTIISGVDGRGVPTKDIVKQLKNKFACGGTYKDGQIELQGNFTKGIKEALVKFGFEAENIEIKVGK